jgi:hypothetical protein
MSNDMKMTPSKPVKTGTTDMLLRQTPEEPSMTDNSPADEAIKVFKELQQPTPTAQGDVVGLEDVVSTMVRAAGIATLTNMGSMILDISEENLRKMTPIHYRLIMPAILEAINYKALLAERDRLRIALVETAIPLEAILLAGTEKSHSPELQDGIKHAVDIIRREIGDNHA